MDDAKAFSADARELLRRHLSESQAIFIERRMLEAVDRLIQAPPPTPPSTAELVWWMTTVARLAGDLQKVLREHSCGTAALYLMTPGFVEGMRHPGEAVTPADMRLVSEESHVRAMHLPDELERLAQCASANAAVLKRRGVRQAPTELGQMVAELSDHLCRYGIAMSAASNSVMVQLLEKLFEGAGLPANPSPRDILHDMLKRRKKKAGSADRGVTRAVKHRRPRRPAR